MDEIDLSLLTELAADARVSWVQLASRLRLSRQTVSDRIQRLEESGILRGFQPVIDPAAVGAHLTAFIGVTVNRPEDCERFLAAIRSIHEVQECHHVAGEDSYLLKVRTQGTRGLEQLITERLKSIQGVVKSRTTVVLSTAKETALPPIYPHVGGTNR